MKPWGLVFFDVDSTLVTIEGIDHLAGDNPEIVRLTEEAMNGAVELEKVYGRRLEIIRPSRSAVEELAGEYLRSLVPGAADVVAELRRRGVDVHLVTAGVEPAILPLAEHLGIRRGAVHAVPLTFSAGGEYLDYDRQSPLARSGGKRTLIRDIRIRSKGRAAMVGDGVSDLEAKPAVDLFIGFGGVVVREAVLEGADRFIKERSLLPVLQILEERGE